MPDTINIINEQLANAAAHSTNWWMWIAIIQFAILFVIILLSFRKKNPIMQEIKSEAMKGETDFENTMQSIFHSTKLYNELKIVCHPDRFLPDVEKQEIADKLFQELTEHKANYKKLLEIKDIAIEKLNINI